MVNEREEKWPKGFARKWTVSRTFREKIQAFNSSRKSTDLCITLNYKIRPSSACRVRFELFITVAINYEKKHQLYLSQRGIIF